MTICTTKFNTGHNGNVRVDAIKTDRDGRFCLRVTWPCGYDSAPSVKWFDSNTDLLAGYVLACSTFAAKGWKST